MKRFLSILFITCISILSILTFTACNHEHSFKSEWSKNATHHWHACSGEGCLEISDNNEHVWDEGTITKHATKETLGIKTFTCTVCNQTKTEPIEYSPCYTVTEEEWIYALSKEAFTFDGYLNVTVKYADAQEEELCYLADGKHVEIITSAIDGKEKLWITDNFTFEEFNKKDCGGVFEMAEMFSAFIYDEEKNSYVYYDETLDDEKYEITFLDKQLVSCTITIAVGTESEESWTHTYFNVGTTTIPNGEIAN